MPTVALPPTIPLTDHVTPVFVLPLTEAVNCCVTPGCSNAELGEMPIVVVVVPEDELTPDPARGTDSEFTEVWTANDPVAGTALDGE